MTMSGTDLLMVKRRADLLAPGKWTAGDQGNSMLVDHGDGLLLVDARPGGDIMLSESGSQRGGLPIGSTSVGRNAEGFSWT